MGQWTTRFAVCLSVLFLLLPTIAVAGDDGPPKPTLAFTGAGAGGPHMSILSFIAPDTAGSGQRITVGWSVMNSGSQPENAAGYDAVYLSFDDQIGCDDTLLGWWPEGEALAAGASYSIFHQVNVMASAPICKANGPTAYTTASPMDFGAKDVPAYLILQVNGDDGEVVTQARPIILHRSGPVTDADPGV